eukprot:scaffold259680_cov40-Prasinocladus_malaysianus.AAC.1
MEVDSERSAAVKEAETSGSPSNVGTTKANDGGEAHEPSDAAEEAKGPEVEGQARDGDPMDTDADRDGKQEASQEPVTEVDARAEPKQESVAELRPEAAAGAEADAGVGIEAEPASTVDLQNQSENESRPEATDNAEAENQAEKPSG